MSQESPSGRASPGGADQWVRPYTSIGPFEIPMISIIILHLAFLPVESMLGAIYESVPPERQANYNNRHYYVDTNYVSSGGRDRMK
jgi:hypothetical protein